MREERRRVERIHLPEPILGSLGEIPILVTEVGLLGARLELQDRLEVGGESVLTFEWGGDELAFPVTIVRCEVQPMLSEVASAPIYHAGVEIREATGSSAAGLRNMIASHVSRALEEQRANALGRGGEWVDSAPFLDVGSLFLKESSPARTPRFYVCCRLDRNGEWHRSQVLKPLQPSDGFTVVGSTPDEQIDLLCHSYRNANEEARRLIRACAEISIAENEDLYPPQRFTP